MKSIEVRKIWDDFWTARKHVQAKPASLIVNSADDPTTMFNTAGMQPLVPYFMGKAHPTWSKRVYNIQGCVRTVDIDEVGDASHLTFFEMMGNWSLGDYFKKESIARSREFLTEVVKLDPEMLCVTIFEWDKDAPIDEEAKQLWLDTGLSEKRITALDKTENRWGPAGATWPCGPDSEIFYRVGEGKPPTGSHPGNDEENRVEIWNNVFMAYYKDDEGHFSELENKNVDTGMGFERILMVIIWQESKQKGEIKAINELSVYNIDIFQDILAAIGSFMSHTYPVSATTDLDKLLLQSYRIVADHLRTAIFLIDEGLTPSNEWRGYVLRRIMRRGYYHLMKIHPEGQDWFANGTISKLLDSVFVTLEKHYSHLSTNKKITLHTIFEEMQQFQSTLDKGSKKFEEMLTAQDWKIFNGNDAFVLYDTYGVPVELTQELVAHHGLTVDMKWFETAMEKAKATSRAWGKQMFSKDIDWSSYIEWLPPTEFVGYENLDSLDTKLLKEFEVNGTKILVFDRTPFYAEWGGQKGDSGIIELDDGWLLKVIDVQKYGGVYLHFVE